jgi:NADPH2:quinone reductase
LAEGTSGTWAEVADWPQAVRDALAGREVTVALDGVGGEAGRAVLELIGMGGRLAIFGWAAGGPTDFTVWDLYKRGLTVTLGIGPRIMRSPGGLRRLEERALAEAAAGRLFPLVGQGFPLSQAAAAHSALETRATVGKVVLVP